MSEREESYVLLEKIQMDDAYLPLRGSPRARAENDRAASQVEDRRTRYRSSPPSHSIMKSIRSTPKLHQFRGSPRRLLPSGPAITLHRVAQCSPTDWPASAPSPPLDVVMRPSLAEEGIRRIYPNSAGSTSCLAI